MEASVPDNRPLNASPDGDELAGGCTEDETVLEDGVIERDPGADEPADESREKTSIWARRTPWLEVEEYDPNF